QLGASMARYCHTLGLEIIVAGRNQYLTFARMIGRADNALLFHAFDDRGSAVIADTETALDVGSRSLPVSQNHSHGLIVRIVGILQIASSSRAAAAAFVLVFILGDRIEIFRHALKLQVLHDALHLVVADEWTVHALNAAAASHEEHIALTEQLLGTLLAQNSAAIDFRRHLEGNTGRE